MLLGKKFTIALCGLLLWAVPLSAHASECVVLMETLYADTAKVDPALIAACAEKGADWPIQWRPQSGKYPGDAGGHQKLRIGHCGPQLVDACPTSNGQHTNVVSLSAGIMPGPPGGDLPELPWKDLEKTSLPCGAVANLSQLALQSVWGNVRFELGKSVDVGGLFNTVLQGVTGAVGRYADCRDGKFWKVLNTAINVIIPQISNEAKNQFTYNSYNHTFLSPLNTTLAFPEGGVFKIDLRLDGADFDLPAGGSFTDINGDTVTIGSNDKVRFNRNGVVNTASGNQYQVDPADIISFDPNGLVRLPKGTQLPIGASGVYPMGSAANPPDWVKREL